MTGPINGTASLEGSSSLALPLDMLGVRTGTLIGSMAVELREQIARERTSRIEYERLVEQSKARERQMVKALAGLEGSRAEPQQQQRNRTGARARDWTPSAEKLIAVWHAVIGYAEDHPDGFSVGAVAGATPGISPEVVRKSMAVFREHELVRPAGKLRGGGIRWKLQPGVTVASAIEIRGELAVGATNGS